jgi:TonB family protein
MMKKYIFYILSVAILIGCKAEPDTGDKSSEAISDTVALDSASQINDSVTEEKGQFYEDQAGNRVYTEVEEDAEFPDGRESLVLYLTENLVYPEESLKQQSEGTVLVSFIINESGSVEDVQVEQPLEDDLLNQEAVRVVKSMPDWNPGTIDNQAVRVKYSLPVAFRLTP